MQVKVDWKDGLKFVGTADSGFEIKLDAKSDVGGNDEGFRPIELIAVSLAGCTAMDVLSILKKKRQEITDFEVHVDATRAEGHPKVITGATIEYYVTGHGVDEKALLRAIQLSAETYCPAQAMLAQVFPITLRYQIFESSEGEERLVSEGEAVFSKN